MRPPVALLALLLVLPTLAGQIPVHEVQPHAIIHHPPIDENSGMVASATYPGVIWVHNDSGDDARFFAIDVDGKVIMPDFVAGRFRRDDETGDRPPFPGIIVDLATNHDWEDIARIDDRLYLADVGNNGNHRRDMGVYEVHEPNPRATVRTRPLRWLPVVYPDQTEFPGTTRWHFDCEAVFGYLGKLYFLTKHRAPGQLHVPESGTNLYRMDTWHTDRPNVLTKVDSSEDMGGWVTAADLSPDGQTLAVLCQAPVASVWLFDTPSRGDQFLQSRARRLILRGARQAEAICWLDNQTLLLGNEQRDLWRVRVDEFALVRP